MKMLFLGILVIAVECGGEQDSIATKIAERDRDRDGKVDLRIETSLRGNTKLMQTISSKRPSGVWTKSRFYYVGDDLLMTESDDDGDGIFETMAIYGPAKQLEVFKRGTDGSIQPIELKELEKYKRQVAIMDEFWDKAFSTTNDVEVNNLLKETQKKLGVAEGKK